MRILELTNAHSWEMSGLIEIYFPAREVETLPKGLQVYNHEKQEITSQIATDELGGFNLKFLAENIPANSTIQYYLQGRITNAEFAPPNEGLMDGNDYYLENDVCRIIVEENGTFTIMHKQEISNDTEEKLIIMGEELGTGSIWAGQNFLKYFKLNQYYYGDSKFHITGATSKLAEASDFFGKIEVKQHLQVNDILKHDIDSILSIQKGENPLIRFKTQIKLNDQSDPSILQLRFPTSLINPNIILEENLIFLFDQTTHRGLVFLGKGINFYSNTDFETGMASVSISKTNDCELPDNGILEYEYAIMPLYNEESINNEEIKQDIERIKAEYFIPLLCHIHK